MSKRKEKSIVIERKSYFAQKLAEIRYEKEWSETKMAKAVGVTRGTIRNWESGAATPDIVKASLVADIAGISLDELVGRCEKNNIVDTGKEKRDGFFDSFQKDVQAAIENAIKKYR